MPAGPNVLQQAGAKPSAEPRGAPLWNDRFFTGLVTQRNILRDPSGVVQERWYGGRPDALIDGLNIELTNRLTLARAPGSTKFSTATLPQGSNSFYSFKQFATSVETIAVMADTPAVLYAINPTSKTTVLTKGVGAGAAFMIGVDNTLYIGDGVEERAWTPISGLRNWGISAGSANTSVSEYAGTATDAGASWSNPTNIEGAPAGSYATAVVAPGGITSNLQATNFGFSAVGVVISGVVMTFTYKGSSIVGGNLIVNVTLLVNGSPVGLHAQFPVDSTSNQVANYSYAGPYAPSIVNASTFGFQVWAQSADGISSGTVYVEGAQITIEQTGATAGSPTGSGSLATTNGGWAYVYEYTNSASGGYSPATPEGAYTGNFTGKSYVAVGVTESTDPQVTGIALYRTKDGGSTYYAHPNNPFPNTTGTLQDSAPDDTLELLQLADLNGLNTPPPYGFGVMEFHLDRIWGAVGNTVYYSSGPDLGLIQGNGNEGVPPANFFTFPSRVTRLMSISTITQAILVVFTTTDIYSILGNGSAIAAASGVGVTVFYAAPLLRRVGLASWWEADVRGAIVYMLTNDGRVISFNPSSQIIYTDPEKSILEIGFPIGDQPPSTSITLLGGSLAGFTPGQCYVTWHGSGSADQALYVSDGATGWFRCNPNQQPDGGAVWSPKRNIVGGCQAVQSIETSPGVYQLLIGPTASSQLPAPRNLAGTPSTGGSLTAGNYFIVVVGVDGSGNTTTVSPEIEVAVPASGEVALTYICDYRTTSVRIYYGSSAGGEANYFGSGNLAAFPLHTTSGASSGSPPSSNTTALTGGFVLYRDPTVWSDSGTAYSYCKARVGANVLAQPGQTASVNFITADFAAQGSQPALSILFDELDAAFTALPAVVNDPPHLAAPSSVYAYRYYTRQAASGTQIPIVCRYMQMWVDFGSTDTVQNELLTLTPFGTYEQEA